MPYAFFLSFQRISRDFRARNAVESMVMGLLIVASSIAILTTVGIVMSMKPWEDENFVKSQTITTCSCSGMSNVMQYSQVQNVSDGSVTEQVESTRALLEPRCPPRGRALLRTAHLAGVPRVQSRAILS